MDEHGDDLLPLTAAVLIRASRERLGLTVRGAARKSDVSEGTWRNVEQGYSLTRGVKIRSNPRPETIATMARAVDVGPSQLEEADAPEAAAILRQGLRSDLRFGGAIDQLPDDALWAELRRRFDEARANERHQPD